MKRTAVAFVLVAFVTCSGLVGAEPVGATRAEEVARAFISERSLEHSVFGAEVVRSEDGRVVLHAVMLEPAGFVLVAADTALPPVVGHSLRNAFPLEGPAYEHVGRLLVADIALRLEQAPLMPRERLEERQLEWQRLKSGGLEKRGLDFWPAAGATTTGGWVEVQWSQGPPYNDSCPLDPVTTSRSAAGCPSVAMAQIINSHGTTNKTRLGDGDDYYHSYAGRDYWIDNDWQARGFPSFPTLANTLDTLDDLYRVGLSADGFRAAALVFACGVAAEQVYTSEGSGTFSVAQAVQAYERFGYYGFELLDESDADLYSRMEQNMKDGRPVHLAIVNPTWTSGHNVVVDGYCSDGAFHLNFGWGGPNDGWYLLPDDMPYGLTVIEGAIVDLVSLLFRDGFEAGNTSAWAN